MADQRNGGIAWTDFTLNPIRFRAKETGRVGHYCEKIAPGCKNCYASKMQEGPYLSGLPFQAGKFVAGAFDKGELFFDRGPLDEMLRRRKPARYFHCDMTDLFGAWVADDWICEVMIAIEMATLHTHQILTKRPGRMLEFLSCPREYGDKWRKEGVHLGTSISVQSDADAAREPMRKLAKAGWLTWVSYEPALGPVDWSGWEFLRWMVAGSESGPSARLMDEDWMRSSRDWCAARKTPFFYKQKLVDGKKVQLPTLDGKVWGQFPEDLR